MGRDGEIKRMGGTVKLEQKHRLMIGYPRCKYTRTHTHTDTHSQTKINAVQENLFSTPMLQVRLGCVVFNYSFRT